MSLSREMLGSPSLLDFCISPASLSKGQPALRVKTHPRTSRHTLPFSIKFQPGEVSQHRVIPEGGKGPQRNPPNWSQNAVCPQRCIGLSGKKGQCYYKGLCFSPVKHSYTWFLGRTVGVTRGISIAITIAISRAARPPVQPPLEGSSNTALLTLLLPIPQDQTATLQKISESAQKTEAGSTQPLVMVYVTGHKYELVSSEVLQGFIPDWSHLTSLCLT